MSEDHIQLLSQPCNSIEAVYYCPKYNLQAISPQSCIPNIIKGKHASCELIEDFDQQRIEQPEDQYVLLVNSPEVTLATTCGPNKQTISGTVLIHYENCDVIINNVSYTTKQSTYWDEIQVIPPIFIKINSSKTIEKLHLQKLKQYHFQSRAAILTLENETKKQTYTSFGSITLIAVVSLTLYLIIKFRKISQHHSPMIEDINIINSPPVQEPFHMELPPRFSWASLHSREGGVMDT